MRTWGVVLLVILVLGVAAYVVLGTDRGGDSESSHDGVERRKADAAPGLVGGGSAQAPGGESVDVVPPESPAHEPASSGTVVLTVVDAATKGCIRGATVLWRRRGKPEVLLRTDANGVVTHELPAGRGARLVAHAPGYARASRYASVKKAGERTELRIELRAGRPVTGQVVDARTGRGIDGAALRVTGDEDFFGISPLLAGATTAPGGAFRLEDVAIGEKLYVHIRAKGYARFRSEEILVRDPATPAEREYRLQPGATITGRVTDPDGHPVEDAAVWLVETDAPLQLIERPEQASGFNDKMWKPRKCRSDAEGGFQFTGETLGGGYRLWAVHARWVRSDASFTVRPTMRERSVHADLQVRRGTTLLVTVRDANGEGVEDATVSAVGPFYREALRGKRAEDGTYRLERVLPGKTTVSVRTARFLDVHETLELADGETRKVEITLESGSAISGVVVDDRGTPVTGASIQAGRPYGEAGRGLSPSSGATKSDEQGRFSIGGLRAGTHRVRVYGLQRAYVVANGVEAPRKGLRIVLPRNGGVVATIVVPAGGTPVRQVQASSSVAVRGSPGSWTGSSTEARWSKDGRLILDDIPSGTVRLKLSFPDYAAVRREIEVPPGRRLDLGDIVLDVGISVAGIVVDVAGKPVAGAEVSGEEIMQRTDGQGRFQLEHIAAGELKLGVDADGFLWHEAEYQLEAGGAPAPLRITLRRGGLVRGTALDQAGKPVTGWVLYARRLDVPGDEGDGWEEVDNRGRFSFRKEPGRYRIELRDGESVLDDAEVRLKEGSEADVALTK